jgi:hypothetical protein
MLNPLLNPGFPCCLQQFEGYITNGQGERRQPCLRPASERPKDPPNYIIGVFREQRELADHPNWV